MNKLAQLIKELPYDDLVKLRKDILEGNMLRLVEDRASSFENPNRVCPVCNSAVDPERALTLYFGPKGLRRRASFDGEDCLGFFVARMSGEGPGKGERGKGDTFINRQGDQEG